MSCKKYLGKSYEFKVGGEIGRGGNGSVYIVPVLKERVSSIDNDIIKQATILELSEENKLFKI